jgi:hypothetical protein
MECQWRLHAIMFFMLVKCDRIEVITMEEISEVSLQIAGGFAKYRGDPRQV